jgi:hypothetical protein
MRADRDEEFIEYVIVGERRTSLRTSPAKLIRVH